MTTDPLKTLEALAEAQKEASPTPWRRAKSHFAITCANGHIICHLKHRNKSADEANIALMELAGSTDFSSLLAAVREMGAENERLKREKDARVYYQDIVYHVCNVLDVLHGRKASRGNGIVCGTVETPSREVQNVMDSLAVLVEMDASERRTLTARNAELVAENERLKGDVQIGATFIKAYKHNVLSNDEEGPRSRRSGMRYCAISWWRGSPKRPSTRTKTARGPARTPVKPPSASRSSTMSTEELNECVAREVMEWNQRKLDQVRWERGWRPSTDPAAMMEVVAKLRDDGLAVYIQTRGDKWECTLVDSNCEEYESTDTPTMMEAVTLAALDAVRAKK